MADLVSIREVGLRDGLQLSKTRLSTKTKLEWCKEQASIGFKEIEVTSFVPASILPQFSDSLAVLKEAQKNESLLASVLVPNYRGAVNALVAGAKKISFVISASDAHNHSNVNCSIEKSLSMLKDFIEECKIKNLYGSVLISGAISTSFGCSIQGRVSPKKVCEIAEKMAFLGVDEISLADTVGYANPSQVSELFRNVLNLKGKVELAGHFHDTRGMGLANVLSAFNVGVKRFDASLGGLGGCPFAPGASGNIATEDCVYMFESMGVYSGVDINNLLKLRKKLNKWMFKDKLFGHLLNSGLPKGFD